MNYRIVAKYLGQFAVAAGALMLLPAAWAVYFGEWNALIALLQSVVVTGLFGGVLYLGGRTSKAPMYQRESLALVGLSWLMIAGIGALPYLLSGTLGPIDAYFESMSGFTTTGASVLTNIEAVDKSILFWRSFTHWVGGMGIILLFIAVLPYLGAGGKQLFKSEIPGPDPRGLYPRIKDTASMLYKIYLTLTAAQTALLMAAGMDLYEALCHTFGTLATGGFSTRNASIAAFDSVAVELIIIIFMSLAGVNFVLYFAMIRGDWRAPLRSTECRVYYALLAAAALLITINLLTAGASFPTASETESIPSYAPFHALRVAVFQSVSIMTTTGYCTDNFDVWPQFSRMLLLVLMFVGGCAGSTGGGIKVVRIIALCKMGYHRLERTFRPRTMRVLRMNDIIIDDEIQRSILVFFFMYLFIFAAGSVFMAFLGLPFQTAVSAVAATLNNIGPGLELVGAVKNYAFVPPVGKIVLSLFMVMGRLELLTICVMFVPAFWKHG